MLNLTLFLVLGASAALSEALTSNISYSKGPSSYFYENFKRFMVKQALEPKGRTYVYSTLHSDKNHSCASYRKYTIQCPYNYCFYYVLYTYETNTAKEKVWHYGELQRPCRHDDYKDYSCLLRMNVSTFSATGKVDEPERKVLMYWNENIGCGVYMVLVNETKVGCELHSRDGARVKVKNTGDLQTCHSEFHKHCQEYIRGTEYMTRCNMQA